MVVMGLQDEEENAVIRSGGLNHRKYYYCCLKDTLGHSLIQELTVSPVFVV